MGFWEILMIGIALSMDAFAVSLSGGMVYTDMKGAKKLWMPIAFGLFQGIMPIAGFYLGSIFSAAISKWSGWVVLVILGLIGLNMIREGIFSKEDDNAVRSLTIKIVLVQALATSIDAFATGVSFAAAHAPLFTAASIIAATTFTLSLIAEFIGNRLGKHLGNVAEILGGVILIIIGIKSALGL